MKKFVVLMMALVLTLAFAGISFAVPKDFDFPVVKDEGKVTFSHAKHLEKLKCDDCHKAGIFKMKPGGGADNITMAEMETGKNCGACHDGTKAFSVKDKEKCGNCHKK